MRRTAVLTLLLLAATACGDKATPAATTTTTTTGGTIADVFTPGNTFSPFRTTIPVGGRVRFNITGAPHNVIFGPSPAGAPADINLVSNTVITRTFNTRGLFKYDCTVHPGMAGEVDVQ